MTAPLLAAVEQKLGGVIWKKTDRYGPNTYEYDLEAAARMVVGWIGPAKELVAALDRVHADPQYLSVWAISQMHVGPYQGPKYDTELNTARAALAALPGPAGEEDK